MIGERGEIREEGKVEEGGVNGQGQEGRRGSHSYQQLGQPLSLSIYLYMREMGEWRGIWKGGKGPKSNPRPRNCRQTRPLRFHRPPLHPLTPSNSPTIPMSFHFLTSTCLHPSCYTTPLALAPIPPSSLIVFSFFFF